MIMMKPRKKANATIATQVRELSNQLSFLDVLRQTCARDGGRYTLTVEAEGAAYTVLVDRGGPFNAIGGGSAGSRALVSASQLRSGRCTITSGWPVDQPLYQPGLDITLKALVDGAVEPRNLPRHRGVDSLRNAEWREAQVVTPAPETTWPSGIVAGPVRTAPESTPLPPQVTPAAPPAPTTASAPVPAPAASPAPAPTPVPPKPEQKMAWKPVGSASAWLPENDLPINMPALEKPAVGKVHAEGQGAAKHLATQALLWLVECEDPSQYTFEKAAAMARKSFVEGVAQMVHPFRSDLDKRISKIKDEWEKSGEVAAKATRKQRKRSTPANSDPDQEFRLR